MIRGNRSIFKVTARARTRFWIVLLIAICALFVGAGYFAKPWQPKPRTWAEISRTPPEHMKVDESKPLRAQTRTFDLAGRIFEIPLMYIDGRPKPGLHQDSMLLEVIWPEMRSVHELADRAEYERVWKVEHRRGWILLHPAANKPSLDEQTANRRLGLTKEEYAGQEKGLEKFLWYHGTPEAPELWAELYFEKDSAGNIVTRIECSRSRSAKFPGCDHKFVDGGLLYDISYNKAALFSEWREQRQRAIDFMNSLEQKNQIPNASKGDQK